MRGGQATTTPMISPPLKWHSSGGKHYLASHIHRIAKRTSYVHRVITHAGGLQEAWNWEYEGISEVINDVNGWLTNFWQVLSCPIHFCEFQRRIEACPFAETIFEAARSMVGKGDVKDVDPVQAAVWLFVCCRQSLAGRMKSFAPTSRNRVRRGMNEQVSAWLTAIEGLPAVHERLKRVLIRKGDGTKIIEQEDGPNTFFYCDPPYFPDSRRSPDVYANEMTAAEHEALLDALVDAKGKFILSGYDAEPYRKRERDFGWSREEISLPNNAAGGTEKRRMTEVIWFNF